MEQKTDNKMYWLRYLGWGVFLLVAVWFFSKIYKTLTIFGLSLLITYLLYPAVHLVSTLKIPWLNRKTPWFVSIIFVYLTVATVIVVAFVILIPSAIEQVENIVNETPKIVAKLQNTIDNIETKYEKIEIPSEVRVRLEQFVNNMITQIGTILGKIFQTIGTVLLTTIQWLFLLLLSSIIAIFVLSDIENIQRNFFSIIPPEYQDDIRDLLVEINNIFGKYIRGYSILCIIDGILTYAMLFFIIWTFRLFGVNFPYFKYTLVASVVAGLTYFIPYLGCTLTVIVGLSLAYLQYPASLGYVLTIGLICLFTNQFVDSAIRPKVLGDALGVSTVFIAFAAIAGSELLGVWGLLIGIPVGVMLISITRFVYHRFLAFPVSDEILEPFKEKTTIVPVTPKFKLEEPELPREKLKKVKLVGLKTMELGEELIGIQKRPLLDPCDNVDCKKDLPEPGEPEEDNGD